MMFHGHGGWGHPHVHAYLCSYMQLICVCTDERRLVHLMSKLSSSIEVSSSSRATAGTLSGGKTKADTSGYAGGIFSRLEAQFRAQQATKALTLQSTQTRQVHKINKLLSSPKKTKHYNSLHMYSIDN